jgi:hypothetical protein
LLLYDDDDDDVGILSLFLFLGNQPFFRGKRVACDSALPRGAPAPRARKVSLSFGFRGKRCSR